MSEMKNMIADNIRVLNEIENQLRDKIIQSISLKDNILSAGVMVFGRDEPTRGFYAQSQFTLNGVSYSLMWEPGDTSHSEMNALIKKGIIPDHFVSRLAEIIAKEILSQSPILTTE